MKYSLTKQQAAVLAYIRKRIEADGVAPSFDEMQAELSLKSRGNVHRIVKALEARGHIDRVPNAARCIRIIE